jgi:hypothetical protein
LAPENKRASNPIYNNSWFISKLFWIWLLPFLRKPIDWWTNTDNYFDLPSNIKLDENLERLEAEWAK